MKPFVYEHVAAVPKIIDNDRVTIRISEVCLYDDNEFVIRVELVNKLADEDIDVVLDSASVNGMQCFPRLDERVPPKDTYESEIIIDEEELDRKIIGEYSDIELNFCIYLPKHYLENKEIYEKIKLYPLGRSKAARYVRQPQPADKVIFDDDCCTVTVTGNRFEDCEYITCLYVENKTDVPVMLMTSDEKINGNKSKIYTDVEVLAGKCGCGEFVWWRSDIVGKLELIEFTLEVFKELGGGKGKLAVAKKAVSFKP